MPTNKKPRKQYRPTYSKLDTMQYVMSGMSLLSPNAKLTLKSINHGSMQALVNGTATRNDWDTICSALNMAVVLSENVFQSGYLQELKDAQVAHALCGRRLILHGRLGYAGLELAAVNTALEIHDQQLEQATVYEIEKAHQEVVRRLRAGHIDHSVKEKTDDAISG